MSNHRTNKARATWRAYHHRELDYRGTEGQCKRWAREREDATIADPYGFIRWTTRNGRLCRVG